MKKRVFQLVERGSHGSRINLLFDFAIMWLIILNMIAIVLDTVDWIYADWHYELYTFELVSVAIFTVEYVLRIYVSDLTHPAKTRLGSVLKFALSTYGIIDLLGILPFYIPLFFHTDAEALRLLLLMRFVRIFKINRYNQSSKIVMSVIRDKRGQLATTVFVAMMLVIMASVLMFFAEGEDQPEAFPNVVACFWWSICTLTTVGYGDVVPITSLGKLLSGLLAFVGLGIVALPTGIISSGFLEYNKKPKNGKYCPHCGERLDTH
ncbi:MAG: ion transporter [Flavobacteriales bacterium]|nr:ion transporter [Flavobacteriales bacterium]